jgi:hypothetical protein
VQSGPKCIEARLLALTGVYLAVQVAAHGGGGGAYAPAPAPAPAVLLLLLSELDRAGA